jgi:hypothetical protein
MADWIVGFIVVLLIGGQFTISFKEGKTHRELWRKSFDLWNSGFRNSVVLQQLPGS